MNTVVLDQRYQLANLRHNGEFLSLLVQIQADIDALAKKIEVAETEEAERRAVADWRALRKVLRRFEELPAGAAVETERERQAIAPALMSLMPRSPADAAIAERIFNVERR